MIAQQARKQAVSQPASLPNSQPGKQVRGDMGERRAACDEALTDGPLPTSLRYRCKTAG